MCEDGRRYYVLLWRRHYTMERTQRAFTITFWRVISHSLLWLIQNLSLFGIINTSGILVRVIKINISTKCEFWNTSQVHFNTTDATRCVKYVTFEVSQKYHECFYFWFCERRSKKNVEKSVWKIFCSSTINLFNSITDVSDKTRASTGIGFRYVWMMKKMKKQKEK